MSAFTTSIPNLLNGVSTQAAALRLPTQGEEQINGYSTLTKGLLKRPPSLLVRNMGSIPNSTNALVHTINRDPVERYFVIITNGDLRVYDLAGNQRTVNFPNGKGYLSGVSNPKTAFSCVTVADYTFIVNRGVVAQMSTSRTTRRNPEAIVNVLAGNYMRDYKVLINGGVAAHYRTGSGLISAGDPNQGDYEMQRIDGRNVNATRIAQALTFGASTANPYNGHSNPYPEPEVSGGRGTGIFTVLGDNISSGAYTLRRMDSTIHIQSKSTNDFNITCEDGFNGNAMKVIKGSTQRFTSLPVKAPNGFHLEVTGESSNNFDNYYVQFVTNQNTDVGEGVWKETTAQNILFRFNAATMPHVLVRESNGTFTFRQATWDDRKVGDDNSSPVPSFIGKTISDVFYHRNRLGFIAGENIIMSASGDVFNFWRRTVTAVLDTDPIDIGPSFPKVSIFRYAQSYNGDLLLFSENLQARVTGGDLLTPKSAAIRMLGEYTFDPNVRPVSSGATMYWVSKDNNRSLVRELWLDETGTIQPPLEANSHCPEFPPTNITMLAASSDLNILAAHSANQPNRLYVYKYYWAGKEKIQTSWSYWDFGKQIISVSFIDTDMYVIIQDGTDTRLLRVPCQVDATDTGMNFMVLLDQRTEITGGTYDATLDRTSYVMPYAPSADIQAWTGFSGTGLIKPGRKLVINSLVGTTIRLVGDTRNERVYVGYPYTMRYRLSPLYVRKSRDGGGDSIITEGRTQVLRVRFSYARTAYFRVLVTPDGRPAFDEEMNVPLLDDPMMSTTDVTLEDGDFSMPVKAENTHVSIDILNDQAVPCGIISAEWVGLWYPKTRRI